MAGLILILLVSATHAQVQSLAPGKGTRDLSAWIAGASGEETTDSWMQAQVWMAGVFFGRVISGEISRGWLRNSMEYGCDLIPIFVTSRTQWLHGFAFDPVVIRFNSSFHSRRVEPYLEGTGGGLITNGNLPPGNTSTFNVTARGGGGIYIFTRGKQALDLGLQWLQASNANLGPDNPQFNGVQFRLGYHWYKRAR